MPFRHTASFMRFDCCRRASRCRWRWRVSICFYALFHFERNARQELEIELRYAVSATSSFKSRMASGLPASLHFLIWPSWLSSKCASPAWTIEAMAHHHSPTLSPTYYDALNGDFMRRRSRFSTLIISIMSSTYHQPSRHRNHVAIWTSA